MLVVTGALVLAVWTYHRFNDEVRQRVELLLARQYPQLVVSIRSAQVIDGEGINVRGLSIFDPEAAGPQAQLCYIDELFLGCATDWQSLLSGQVDITHVQVRNPTLRMALRADGSWSLARLLPLPTLGGAPPTMTVENGTLEVIDPRRNPASVLVLRGAQLKAEPEATPGDTTRPPLRITGQLTGDYLRRAEINLLFDPDGASWELSGTFDGLEMAPEMAASLPGDLPRKLEPLRSVRATTQGRFSVRRVLVPQSSPIPGAPRALPEYQFDVTGQIVRGRVDDARLPYPLTDLKARFRATHEGFWLDELVGRHGQAMVRVVLARRGCTEHSPLTAEVNVQRLSLDRKLVDILPDDAVAHWHRFLPAGEIDLDLKLACDGQAWRTDIVARLLNVSFTYHKFPYRLERAAGSVSLRGDTLALDLLAYSHTEPVRVVGQFHLEGSQPWGEVEVRGQNLRIDEKLLASLDDNARELLRSFRPYGVFHLQSRFWRGRDEEEFHRDIYLGLNRCSLRFERFAYPLDDVRGTIEVHDGQWTFRNLEGVNDTGLVTCNGQLIPSAEGGQLTLSFTGTNITLEPELRDALSPAARQLWNGLKPRGAIHLRTEFTYHPQTRQQSLWVRAEPVPGSMSIEPDSFAWRMEDLRGTFVYQNGQVLLQDLRARHQNTTVSAQGLGTLQPGGWELRLERLAVDRLAVDRDLLHAVPERLRRLLSELRPGGLFNLRGSLELAGSDRPDVPLRTRWQGQIDFAGNTLHVGLPLEHIHGGLTLAGATESGRTYSAGELKIDSLIVRQMQFTDVMGPLWIDDEAALLGIWADRKQGSTTGRRLTAKVLGGTLVGDAWAAPGNPTRYAIQASLAQADVGQAAQQLLPGTQNVRGNLFAEIDLRGSGAAAHGLDGRGQIQLRDADIYQLPSMVQLLKLLSVRPPDATAFTSSDVDFRIEGEHVYIDRIDFNGDAISLRGAGEMGFNSELRLAFHALVGRNDILQIPLLRELVGGASQQLMMIHVDGTLAQPHIRREAFPVVNQALQQLQAELNVAPPLASPSGASRR